MQADEQLFYKIEDYLRGKLSQEESEAFEVEINANPALAELVKTQRFEREGMEYLVEKDLQEKLKKWETHPPVEIDMVSGRSYKWFWYILALLLIISPFIYFTLGNIKNEPSGVLPENNDLSKSDEDVPIATSKPSETTNNISEKDQVSKPPEPQTKSQPQSESSEYLAMFQQAYTFPDRLRDQQRNTMVTTDSTSLQKGIIAFNEKKYASAAAIFEGITAERSPDQYEMAQEWLGHAYLNNNEFLKAAQIFQKLADKGGMRTKDRAEWYLLLSYLPNFENNRTEIEALLDKITDPEAYHNYAEAGKKIKELLKKQ